MTPLFDPILLYTTRLNPIASAVHFQDTVAEPGPGGDGAVGHGASSTVGFGDEMITTSAVTDFSLTKVAHGY